MKPIHLLSIYQVDWLTALNHKLREHILRSDAQVEADAAQTNNEAGAEHRVVDDVRDVLWEHHDVIYMVFSYYASLTTDGDKFSISLNSYHKLYVDCGLSVPNSVACQKRHLDQLFIAVNTIAKGSGRAVRHNHARQLNRQEH